MFSAKRRRQNKRNEKRQADAITVRISFKRNAVVFLLVFFFVFVLCIVRRFFFGIHKCNLVDLPFVVLSNANENNGQKRKNSVRT